MVLLGGPANCVQQRLARAETDELFFENGSGAPQDKGDGVSGRGAIARELQSRLLWHQLSRSLVLKPVLHSGRR